MWFVFTEEKESKVHIVNQQQIESITFESVPGGNPSFVTVIRFLDNTEPYVDGSDPGDTRVNTVWANEAILTTRLDDALNKASLLFVDLRRRDVAVSSTREDVSSKN